jgi:hypothetical protein
MVTVLSGEEIIFRNVRILQHVLALPAGKTFQPVLSSEVHLRKNKYKTRGNKVSSILADQ